MKWILIISWSILAGCASTKITGPLVPTDWQLCPTPNASDEVGSIFALRKGSMTQISSVTVNTAKSTTVVPASIQASQVDYRVLLDFLSLKPNDSLSADFSRKKLMTVSFQVSNAINVRPDDNLEEAYEKKRKEVTDNLRFLDLGKADVYFITEVIQSPKVNILVKHNTVTDAKAGFVFNQLIRLKQSIHVQGSDSSMLQYDLGESLSIMYKAKKLAPRYVKVRGPEGSRDSLINLEWTNDVPTELLINQLTAQ